MNPHDYPAPAPGVQLPQGMTLGDVIEVKRQIEGEWIEQQGVTAIDVGLRRRGGTLTQEVCLRLSVTQKLPVTQLTREHTFPSSIAGIPTDVLERQRHRPGVDSGSYRPVIGGISIGPLAGSGTLTCIVRERGTGTLLLMSNAHVFYYDWYKTGTVGTDGRELQPGGADGGFTTVGTRLRYVYEANDSTKTGVDAAVASISPVVNVDGKIAELGVVAGSADPQLGSTVQKRGRTTGLTTGTIEGIDATVVSIGPAFSVARQYHQVVVSGTSGTFFAEGDSGSPLVDSTNHIVAILGTSAGGSMTPPVASDSVGGGAPIRAALDALGVDVYVGGPSGTAGDTTLPPTSDPPPAPGGGTGTSTDWVQGDIGALFLESGATPASDFPLRVDDLHGGVTNGTLATPDSPASNQAFPYLLHLPNYAQEALIFDGYATLGGRNVEDPPDFLQFPPDSDLSGPLNAGIAPWAEMPELHQWAGVGSTYLRWAATMQVTGPGCFLRAFELRHSPYTSGTSWQLDRRDLFEVHIEANGALSVKTTATPSGYAETLDTVPTTLIGQVVGAAVSPAGVIPFGVPFRLQFQILLDTGIPTFSGALLSARVNTTTVLGSFLGAQATQWVVNPYPASGPPDPTRLPVVDCGLISGIDFGAVTGGTVILRDIAVNVSGQIGWIDNWAVDSRLVDHTERPENPFGFLFPWEGEVLSGGFWSGSDSGASRISGSFPMLALSATNLFLTPLPPDTGWDFFASTEGRAFGGVGRRNHSDFHVPSSLDGEEWWMTAVPMQNALGGGMSLPLMQERREAVLWPGPVRDWKYFRGQPGEDGIEHSTSSYIPGPSELEFPLLAASSATFIESNYAHSISLRSMPTHLFHIPLVNPDLPPGPDLKVPPTLIRRVPVPYQYGTLVGL